MRPAGLRGTYLRARCLRTGRRCALACRVTTFARRNEHGAQAGDAHGRERRRVAAAASVAQAPTARSHDRRWRDGPRAAAAGTECSHPFRLTDVDFSACFGRAATSPIRRRTLLTLIALDGMGWDWQGVDIPKTIWSANALIVDPEAVVRVHTEFIQAGARVITTCSYGTV